NGQLVSLAEHHGELTEAGARTVGISVDPPEANAAMVEKLSLPFPLLSDPDGTGAIKDTGVWHEGKPFARPAVVVVDTDGSEVLRQVGEDFADRLAEEDLVAAVRDLGRSAVRQDPPTPGTPRPGKGAVPLAWLPPYFLGSRYAVVALSERVPEAQREAKAMIPEFDRFRHATQRRLKEDER
ncbi:MAG TPA: redoxin domain-containing protein, partial [Acidimicrobiales bacterium]|nr:redoxin domain-containing protein [Acidimicrobiales bacterium]